MKRVFSLLLVAAAFTACGNDGDGTKDPIDSTEQRKDTLIENIDSTAQAKKDSIEQWEKSMKEKVDSMTDKRIDSLKNKQ